jgi:hypothetical protein
MCAKIHLQEEASFLKKRIVEQDMAKKQWKLLKKKGAKASTHYYSLGIQEWFISDPEFSLFLINNNLDWYNFCSHFMDGTSVYNHKIKLWIEAHTINCKKKKYLFSKPRKKQCCWGIGSAHPLWDVIFLMSSTQSPTHLPHQALWNYITTYLLIYMWTGFLLLSDCKNSNCATTSDDRSSEIYKTPLH